MFVSKLAASFLFLGVAIVAAEDTFVCDNPSENDDGDYIDKAIGFQYCLDSDPIPPVIFEPSNLNLFTMSFEGTAITHLGDGFYVYGDGAYMAPLIVYEKDCDGGSKKGGKGGGKNEGKGGGKGQEKKEGKGGGKGGENKGDKGGKGHYNQKEKDDKGKEGYEKQTGGGYTRGLGKKAGKSGCYGGIKYGAILVDAPPTTGPQFGAFLKDFLDSIGAELEAMIVTHEHYDHAGNLNSVLEYNPTLDYFIAHKEVAEVLEEWATGTFENNRVSEIFNSNPDFPHYEFDLVIDEEYTLTMGNQTLELRPTVGHTSGNLIIWHEASKTLTNIDTAVFPKWSPFFNFAKGSDVFGLFKLFDVYREYEFKYFVGGHVTHVGVPEDVELSEIYATDLLDAGFRAFKRAAADENSKANLGNILQNTVNVFSGPNAGNAWLAFNEYLTQIAIECAKIVLDENDNYSGYKWIDELAGVRPTVFTHCQTLASSLRIDTPGGL